MTPDDTARLAALLDGITNEVREAVLEGDAQDCSSADCIADAVYEIVRHRLIAAGVTLARPNGSGDDGRPPLPPEVVAHDKAYLEGYAQGKRDYQPGGFRDPRPAPDAAHEHEYDHDGMARHHHDRDTGAAIWWSGAEQFGGERIEHQKVARPAPDATLNVERLLNAAHRMAKWTDTMKGEEGGAFVYAMRQADEASYDLWRALREYGIGIADRPPAALAAIREDPA